MKITIEIEGLLYLHRDDLGHVIYKRFDRFFLYAFDRVADAALYRFGLLKAEAEASLKHVSELAAADRNVACE